jgi:uncharacterized protein YjiS (DUF1127 family)
MASSTIASRVLPATGQVLAGPWRVARVVKQLIARIRSERRIRADIAELRALDDHLLTDIGLTRGHIEYASRYGRPLDV